MINNGLLAVVVARDDDLVRSIIELAHNLGLSLVAEGVEASPGRTAARTGL